MTSLFGTNGILTVDAGGSFIGIDDCSQASGCGCSPPIPQEPFCNGYSAEHLFCNDLPAPNTGNRTAQWVQNLIVSMTFDSSFTGGPGLGSTAYNTRGIGTVQASGPNIFLENNVAGLCATTPLSRCIQPPALNYTLTDNLRNPATPAGFCDFNTYTIERTTLGSLINIPKEGDALAKSVFVTPNFQFYVEWDGFTEPGLGRELCIAQPFLGPSNPQRYRQTANASYTITDTLTKSMQIAHDSGARDYMQRLREYAAFSASYETALPDGQGWPIPTLEARLYDGATGIEFNPPFSMESDLSIEWSDKCCKAPSSITFTLATRGHPTPPPGFDLSTISGTPTIYQIIREWQWEEYGDIVFRLRNTGDNTSSYEIESVTARVINNVAGLKVVANTKDITSSCSASTVVQVVHNSLHPTLGSAASNDFNLICNIDFQIGNGFFDFRTFFGKARITAQVSYAGGPAGNESTIMCVCPETEASIIDDCTGGTADSFIIVPVVQPLSPCQPGWVSVQPDGSPAGLNNQIIVSHSLQHLTYERDDNICPNEFLLTRIWGGQTNPGPSGFAQPLTSALGGCDGYDTGFMFIAGQEFVRTWTDCNSFTEAIINSPHQVRHLQGANNGTTPRSIVGSNNQGEPTYTVEKQYDNHFMARIGQRFQGPHREMRPILIVSTGGGSNWKFSVTTYEKWLIERDPAASPFRYVQTWLDFADIFQQPNVAAQPEFGPTPTFGTTNIIRGVLASITQRVALKNEFNKYYEMTGRFHVMFHGNENNWFQFDDPERFYNAFSLAAETPRTGCNDNAFFGVRAGAADGIRAENLEPQVRAAIQQQLQFGTRCRGCSEGFGI